MIDIAYTVEVDTANDGTFAADISAYVQEMSWSEGMALWQPMARVGQAEFTLNNADRRFSPENAASPYYSAATKTLLRPHVKVRVRVDLVLVSTASPANIVPTGTSLLTNGNMETGDPPADWTANAATLDGVADERTGGAGAQALDVAADGTYEYPGALQALSGVSTGDWLYWQHWGKNVDASGGVGAALRNTALMAVSYLAPPVFFTGTSWALHYATARAASTQTSVALLAFATAAGEHGRFDDVYCAKLDTASCFDVDAQASADAYVQAGITRAAYTQAGLAHWSDVDNFVIAYEDGAGTVRLVKRVGGVYTEVDSAAVTYGAGKALRLNRERGVYAVSYDGTEIIAATIDDAVFDTALSWGRFSTYANVFANYTYGIACTLWTGLVTALEPEAGQYGPRTARLRAAGMGARLENMRVDQLALQADKRSDEVIAALLSLVRGGNWLLGVPGQSELGANTYLGGSYFSTAGLRQGQETFVYAGDDWFGESTTIAAAIEAVCRSEGYGRFYFGRDGEPVFWDRHYLQERAGAPVAYDDGDFAALSYAFDVDGVVNEVVVEMEPRKAGASGTIYEHQGSPIQIPAKSERAVRCPFADANGKRIGATVVSTPVKGVDWHANTEADGSGYSYDTYAEPTLTMVTHANYAELTFKNGAIGPLYVYGLRITGTPLVTFDPEAFSARDGASQSRYGPRPLAIGAPLLNTPAVGSGLARYTLLLRAAPRGAVEVAWTPGTDARRAAMLVRRIGDAVRLSETQTALADMDFYIVGESHRVSRTALWHETQWMLEPKAPFDGWLLGVAGRAELGQTTLLGF